MNTKVTLTIENEIIQRAKKYANKKNQSLSHIVENYLRVLIKEDQKSEAPNLNPIVQSLRGSFKTSEKMDYKKELKKDLDDKYF